MAIKILKEGKKEFTIKCPKCECEFMYELEDITSYFSYSSIKCPNCRSELAHSDRVKYNKESNI